MAIDIANAAVFNGPYAPSDADLSRCVHCGCCLNACPTYRVTGLESESPRGRIFFMDQVKHGRIEFSEGIARHLEHCLGCRTCEAVCPSGVPYGRLIEHTRSELDRVRPTRRARLTRFGLRQVVAHPRRLAAVAAAARAGQVTRLNALVPIAETLPALGRRYRPPRGRVAPASGERRFRVAFLTGCVMPVLYPRVHAASVRLLQLAGAEVWFPPGQTCCGALAAHSGDLAGAERLRERNLAAFGRETFDNLVVDSAGCGAHLKDAYGELGAHTLDLSVFLARAGLPEPQRRVEMKVSYQDPCHLAHAQGIRREPRQLIRAVPGIELVESAHPDACCGSAGLYSTLEPEMSGKVLDMKLDDVLEAAPQAVITANPGCQIQLQSGLRKRGRDTKVMHLAELLMLAYG
jgi:glycolate oxidase iron-sulfur subunit